MVVDVTTVGLMGRGAELFFGFRLGFAKDILVDVFPCGGIVSCGIASLPAAVFSLS